MLLEKKALVFYQYVVNWQKVLIRSSRHNKDLENNRISNKSGLLLTSWPNLKKKKKTINKQMRGHVVEKNFGFSKGKLTEYIALLYFEFSCRFMRNYKQTILQNCDANPLYLTYCVRYRFFFCKFTLACYCVLKRTGENKNRTTDRITVCFFQNVNLHTFNRM